jgi:hypothetical protein
VVAPLAVHQHGDGTLNTIQTVSLAYNFLGHARFGAVEWRGPE